MKFIEVVIKLIFLLYFCTYTRQIKFSQDRDKNNNNDISLSSNTNNEYNINNDYDLINNNVNKLNQTPKIIKEKKEKKGDIGGMIGNMINFVTGSSQSYWQLFCSNYFNLSN